jgi:hypothetical protein
VVIEFIDPHGFDAGKLIKGKKDLFLDGLTLFDLVSVCVDMVASSFWFRFLALWHETRRLPR